MFLSKNQNRGIFLFGTTKACHNEKVNQTKKLMIHGGLSPDLLFESFKVLFSMATNMAQVVSYILARLPISLRFMHIR